MLWRRSYDVPPPPLADDSPFSQVSDPRYADLPPEIMPRTECLADVLARVLPYWYDVVAPQLLAGQNVLITAHGNSLRALVMHLEGVSPDEIAALIPDISNRGSVCDTFDQCSRLLDQGHHAATGAALEARLHQPDLAHVGSQLAPARDVADARVEHGVDSLLQRRE